MDRFVEWFVELDSNKLVSNINKYAAIHNLKIISFSTNNDLSRAIVLFEGIKPKNSYF